MSLLDSIIHDFESVSIAAPIIMFFFGFCLLDEFGRFLDCIITEFFYRKVEIREIVGIVVYRIESMASRIKCKKGNQKLHRFSAVSIRNSVSGECENINSEALA